MIRVELIRAWPRRFESCSVELRDGACVGEALLASSWTPDGTVALAVFGERAGAATVLHDGDRIELLRPLVADPKEARRRRAERAKSQP